MVELLELIVIMHEDPRYEVRSYRNLNVEDEDTFPKYEFLLDALQDGWQLVSVQQPIEHAGQWFQSFWLQRKRGTFTTSGWHECFHIDDDQDEITDLPEDGHNVLAMLNGYCDIHDMEGRQGGPHGIMKGWYDAEKGFWRVGSYENRGFVTHWHELPPEPLRK